MTDDAFYSSSIQLFSGGLLYQAQQILDIELRSSIADLVVIERAEVGKVEAIIVLAETQGCLFSLHYQIDVQMVDASQASDLFSQGNLFEDSAQVHNLGLKLHVLLGPAT